MDFPIVISSARPIPVPCLSLSLSLSLSVYNVCVCVLALVLFVGNINSIFLLKLYEFDYVRIDFYSSKHNNSAPLQGWLQRIENGQITVDGTVVDDPNTILRVGSELVYHRRPWKEPDVPHVLEVLFEDDHLIALNKPSGLQVLPGGLFQQRTVLTQLQWRMNKHRSSLEQQDFHPVPVHRLGRGTSGILLCAKTKLSRTRLAAYFADKTSVIGGNRDTNMELDEVGNISKIYRALVSGILDYDEVVIEQPIGTQKYPGVAKGLYVASFSGKPALSKVQVLERDVQNDHTVVQVEIQSGRPHQIRTHLSFIGHPLIGDPLYVTGGLPKCSNPETIGESFAQDGGYERPINPVPGDCGYHLHAHQLILSHPITNEVFRITAPLPYVLQTKKERGCLKRRYMVGSSADEQLGQESTRSSPVTQI